VVYSHGVKGLIDEEFVELCSQYRALSCGRYLNPMPRRFSNRSRPIKQIERTRLRRCCKAHQRSQIHPFYWPPPEAY